MNEQCKRRLEYVLEHILPIDSVAMPVDSFRQANAPCGIHALTKDTSMADITLYGPSFSSFLRTARLMSHHKGLSTTNTLAPFGEKAAVFSDDHAKLHPFKKMPVLIDGDLVLPESLAIAFYLDTKPGPKLFPEDDILKAQVVSDGNMLALYFSKPVMGQLVLEFAMPKGENGEVRLDVAQQNLPAVQQLLTWLSEKIGERTFISAHQFTYCDAVVLPVLDYLTQLPAPFDIIHQFPVLTRYLAHHRAAPYTQGVLGEPDFSELQG